MRKLLILACIVLLLLTLMACGTSTVDAPKENGDINIALENIKNAKTKCDELYNIVDHYWNYNGFENFFDYNEFLEADSKFNKSGNYNRGSFYGDAKRAFEIRDNIDAYLSNAKNELKKCGANELKSIVEDLYITVNSYSSLLSKYPSGYSQFTFSSSISDLLREYEDTLGRAELAS